MKILVIKLGAFGDVVLSFAAFNAIRQHHPDAHITFLTIPAFKTLAETSPYFDQVITFDRPPFWKVGSWLQLFRFFSRAKYDLVYDMQRNDRTRLYKSFGSARLRQSWLGNNTEGYRLNPQAIDVSDIMRFYQPPLDWLKHDLSQFNLPQRYALLVPGCAPQHPAKRWPAEHYAALAQRLAARGVTPVLLGTAAEANATSIIAQACPQAIDLTARTSFADIASLAQQAVAAVGNDTGPMHLISICGCPVVSLFSRASNPEKSAPRGNIVKVLRADHLADVAVSDVDAALQTIERV